MQRMFSALKQAVRKSFLVLGLLSLLMSGLFITQPTLAAPISAEGQKLIQQQKMGQESQAANYQREQAYEEQVEAAKDPDKVYEENLKEFKESHPGENIVEKAVEGAKDAVEKVTGK